MRVNLASPDLRSLGLAVAWTQSETFSRAGHSCVPQTKAIYCDKHRQT